MVNPDIMSKKNLLKIACAHPELPVEGEHDRSLTPVMLGAFGLSAFLCDGTAPVLLYKEKRC